MKVNDLLGAGKGIDKLIDVIRKGVGRVSKSYFEKKDIETRAFEIERLAEAKAKAIGVIADAIRQNSLGTGGVEYSSDGVKIVSSQGNNEFDNYVLQETVITDRLLLKESYQGIIKQLNIENVTAIAAEELKNENEISDESVNEDWINRFFRIIEDVSDEEMQALWGKILAGEIKQPNTYSIRTLEMLRNLSKYEAETLIKVANLAIIHNEIIIIFKGDKNIYNDYGVKYLDIALMVEVGILQSGDFTIINIKPEEEKINKLFVFGEFGLLVGVPPDAKRIEIPVVLYTKSGVELLKLLNVEIPEKYINDFSSFLKKQDSKLKTQYGRILNREGDMYNFDNLVDV